MAYRYVFPLLATVDQMYQARKARKVSTTSHGAGARRFLGASVGTLFGKAHHLSEEVRQAMVARDWRGEARALRGFRLRAVDVLAALVAVVLSAATYGGDLYLGH